MRSLYRKQLVGAALAVLALVVPAAAEPLIGRASAIDGDTIDLHGTRIRLEGIHAPESRQMCMSKVDPASAQPVQKLPCGRRAAFFLANLIGERPVKCVPDGLDRCRRILAHCSVDGADISKAIVRAGWALAFVRYSLEYVADEQTAREVGASANNCSDTAKLYLDILSRRYCYRARIIPPRHGTAIKNNCWR